jgi:hypothetical protein
VHTICPHCCNADPRNHASRYPRSLSTLLGETAHV